MNGAPTPPRAPGPKGVRPALGLLLVAVGLSALPAGWSLAADPTGAALGLSLEALRGSLFTSYRIPGLVLLLFHGLGGAAAGVWVLRGSRLAGPSGVLFGALLLGWMLVQLATLGLVHWLQPMYVALGLAEVALGILLLGPRHERGRFDRGLRWGTGLLCLFTGLTATAGGIELLVWPQGTKWLSTPVTALEGTPFDNFAAPGVLLLAVIGLGSLAAAVLLLRRKAVGGWAVTVAGIALTVWILAEMALLTTHSGIEILYLAIGLLTTAGAFRLASRRDPQRAHARTLAARAAHRAPAP